MLLMLHATWSDILIVLVQYIFKYSISQIKGISINIFEVKLTKILNFIITCLSIVLLILYVPVNNFAVML